jgi:hypothetical protein
MPVDDWSFKRQNEENKIWPILGCGLNAIFPQIEGAK